MRVLLLSAMKRLRAQQPCLGLRYLSAHLASKGHDTRVVELGELEEGGLSELDRHMAEMQPQVVGISIWCHGYRDSLEVASCVRRTAPGTAILAGGPLATYIAPGLLETGLIDFVVRGQGEIATAELLEVIQTEGVAAVDGILGVSSRGHENVNGFAPPVVDLDSMPFPDRRLTEGFRVQASLMTTRGCTGSCIFCANKKSVGGILQRSVNNIMSEVAGLKSAGIGDHLWFLDDELTLDPDRTMELCAAFRKEAGTTFSCHVRADVSEEVVECLMRSGCTGMSVGVESADQEVLDAIHKRIDLDQVERLARQLNRLNRGALTCYFMLGHYCDTPDTMRRTIDLAARLVTDFGTHPVISFNTPFPGTVQYVHREKLGLRIHAQEWDEFDPSRPMVSAEGFTLEELQGMYTYAAERLSPRNRRSN